MIERAVKFKRFGAAFIDDLDYRSKAHYKHNVFSASAHHLVAQLTHTYPSATKNVSPPRAQTAKVGFIDS